MTIGTLEFANGPGAVVRATLQDDGSWSCADREVRKFLDKCFRGGGMVHSCGDRRLTNWRKAVTFFHARVIAFNPPAPPPQYHKDGRPVIY